MTARTLAQGMVLAVALAGVAPARARGNEGRPWYVPDHAKLQLAGNIGFLSPGVGYAWGRHLEGDLFFGWVPESFGGADIFSVTGKLTWAPWSIETRPWSLRPITFALQLTYTFGDQYSLAPWSEEFLEFTPTSLRSGIAFGAEVRRAMGGRSLGIYAELVALDMGLLYWLTNGDALGPTDIFSLAIGARLAF